ncbi:MAG: bifunctional N-acetylglucosamine-1-phosphate uridyltransferase/glucosamine-1-phosphate acetyltransferase [Nitrospirae bacterium]|nr:bifunctional N-acetylglucosamine-1-phosphate uridyltransferase/glucosamine-1-phosphate acetyltransferase [Nitrospirota bacterium]
MNICAVILAAGRGKRMNSLKPKVLHEVLGRPMIRYAVDAAAALKPKKIVIVVNSGADEVKQQVKDGHVSFVFQKKLLGTGHALAEAKKALKGMNRCTIVVINGDSPLITGRTLKTFLRKHTACGNDLSVGFFIDESLSGYGRILRDESGIVTGIIEDKHATSDEKRGAGELNAGIYAIEPLVMDYLSRLRLHGSSGEYYLTDIVREAVKARRKVEAYECPAEEVRGVNTRAELFQAADILNKKIILKWMMKGVSFMDPAMTIVQPSVKIGKDTVIHPNTYFEGSTSIGRNCVIYPGVRICGSSIGSGVIIKDNSLIEDSKIEAGSVVGPLAHFKNNKG